MEVVDVPLLEPEPEEFPDEEDEEDEESEEPLEPEPFDVAEEPESPLPEVPELALSDFAALDFPDDSARLSLR